MWILAFRLSGRMLELISYMSNRAGDKPRSKQNRDKGVWPHTPLSKASPTSLWTRFVSLHYIKKGVVPLLYEVRGKNLSTVSLLSIAPTSILSLALWDSRAFFLTEHAMGSAGGSSRNTAIRCWRDRCAFVAASLCTSTSRQKLRQATIWPL